MPGWMRVPPLAREAAMATHRGGAGHERRRDKNGEEEVRASSACGSKRWEASI